MPPRPEVRDTQRIIATLDAVHRRAADRLDRALARRAELLGEQDRQVAVAQAGVDQAIVEMAKRLSVELSAQVLGLDPGEVRRLARINARADVARGSQ